MTKIIPCGRCGYQNKVTKFIYNLHQHKKIKIRCKKCKQPVVLKSQLPPTPGQLRYIQGLGGSITGIRTREQAGNKINELEWRKNGTHHKRTA